MYIHLVTYSGKNNGKWIVNESQNVDNKYDCTLEPISDVMIRLTQSGHDPLSDYSPIIIYKPHNV